MNKNNKYEKKLGKNVVMGWIEREMDGISSIVRHNAKEMTVGKKKKKKKEKKKKRGKKKKKKKKKGRRGGKV